MQPLPSINALLRWQSSPPTGKRHQTRQTHRPSSLRAVRWFRLQPPHRRIPPPDPQPRWVPPRRQHSQNQQIVRSASSPLSRFPPSPTNHRKKHHRHQISLAKDRQSIRRVNPCPWRRCPPLNPFRCLILKGPQTMSQCRRRSPVLRVSVEVSASVSVTGRTARASR